MGKTLNNLIWNPEAHSVYIYYVAMSSGPLMNPANLAHVVVTVSTPGITFP